MKKLLLLLFVVAIGTTAAQAQINFGVRAGANVSGYQTENGKGSARYAPSFGAFAQIKVWKIAIQPELNYSSQGVYGDLALTDFTDPATAQALQEAGMEFFNGSKEFVDKVNYLQVPVMVKFYPVKGLNIQVGPQFGYVLGAKRQYSDEFVTDMTTLLTISGQDPSALVQEGSIDNFKSTDISLNVGVGFEIWKLDIAARYNFGLTQLDKETVTTTLKDQLFSAPDGTTRNIQFSVGYKIF